MKTRKLRSLLRNWRSPGLRVTQRHQAALQGNEVKSRVDVAERGLPHLAAVHVDDAQRRGGLEQGVGRDKVHSRRVDHVALQVHQREELPGPETNVNKMLCQVPI